MYFFMTEENLKEVLAKYQQKSFELFNKNIVLETQVESLTSKLNLLTAEVEKLKKTKRGSKPDENF